MKFGKWILFISMIVLTAVAIGIVPGITNEPTILAQGDPILVSVPVTEAPTLDGLADEVFWADAEIIEVELRRGANMGESVVNIKSVYTEDSVYFLVTWTDPTESYLRFPWEMQEDGSWIQLSDPENTGGDDNMWYEDKFAFIWPINNSIDGFEEEGCFMACHSGDDDDTGKAFGNKFTENEGEMGDIWHWKSVRNIGQAHDQYLDWTPWSEDTPEAGRHSDPKDSGGYSNNVIQDADGNKLPAFMPAGDDFPRDGSPGFIPADETVEFDPSIFEPGDRIPGMIVTPFVGDSGDISAGWNYADGMWTLELGRALVTESEFDVQFDDLSAQYYFGVAAFDNAQVRHAFQRGSNVFVFGE
jgi:hypothetical protein